MQTEQNLPSCKVSSNADCTTASVRAELRGGLLECIQNGPEVLDDCANIIHAVSHRVGQIGFSPVGEAEMRSSECKLRYRCLNFPDCEYSLPSSCTQSRASQMKFALAIAFEVIR